METLPSYQQLVQQGEIHQWQESVDANEVASGVRFNLNQKAAINHSLKAFSMASELVKSLSEQTATKEDLFNTKNELNRAIELCASAEWVDDQNKNLMMSISDLQKNIDNLNDTFAMDSELADKVAQITQAMTQAIASGGDSVKNVLTQLINDRYTKSESDQRYAQLQNTYTKSEIDNKTNLLSEKTATKDELALAKKALLDAIGLCASSESINLFIGQAATKDDLILIQKSLNESIALCSTSESVQQQNSELIDLVSNIQKQIDNLNDTFAMDSELADKVAQITQAMTQAIASGGDSVKNVLTQLINDRYTKSESDQRYAQLQNVYVKSDFSDADLTIIE